MRQKPPSPLELSKKRGDGVYATLTKADNFYLCEVVQIEDGQEVFKTQLDGTSMGGHLQTLANLKGYEVKAVTHRAPDNGGLNKALSRLSNPPMLVCERIE